jgi:integrase
MTATALRLSPTASTRPDRQRPWLCSNYDANEWLVCDTGIGTDSKTLDFKVPMPDGRLLTEHPRLYATVKEFTFWIREGIHISFDDAEQHRNYFSAIVQFSYAIVEKGRSSFAELTKLDIEELADAASFGADRLYGAASKVKKLLAPFEKWEQVPKEFRKKREFDRDAVLTACNLPTRRNPKIHHEFACAAARLNEEDPPKRPQHFDHVITATNVGRYLVVLEALHVLRFVMKAEGLLFMPFPEGAEARGALMGKKSEKTPIAPIKLILSFLENSVRFLMNSRSDIIERYRKVCLARAHGLYDHKEGILARKEVGRLATACFVLIAAFTARRTAEIWMTERDCLAGNDDYGWWMKVFIVKNHREKTWIPVPNIVARAVETLRQLDFRNELSAQDTLFMFFDATFNKVVKLHVHLRLNEYAEFVRAQDYSEVDGKPGKWHWSARQFRRFFAVLYLYRYQGSIEALSHHLRHFNLEMTRSYLTLDPELRSVWLSEEWGFKRRLATAIATGDVSYSGAMGERLKKLAKKVVQKFHGEITIVQEQVAELILRSIDRRHYVFTPKPWVTCTCPNTPTGSKRAMCRKLDEVIIESVGPNFANAGPTVCSNCPWALLNSTNRKRVDYEIERLNAVNDNPPTTLFGELQAANLVKLTAFRAKLSN